MQPDHNLAPPSPEATSVKKTYLRRQLTANRCWFYLRGKPLSTLNSPVGLPGKKQAAEGTDHDHDDKQTPHTQER